MQAQMVEKTKKTISAMEEKYTTSEVRTHAVMRLLELESNPLDHSGIVALHADSGLVDNTKPAKTLQLGPYLPSIPLSVLQTELRRKISR